MKKSTIVIGLLVAVVFVLLGWQYFEGKKVEVGEIKSSPEVKKINTITIGNGPIEFDLPEGYVVHTSGSYEGGYRFTVRVGKLLRENYFSEAIPTIEITDYAPQFGSPKEYKVYKPSEYVDLIFANAHPELNKPKILTLFGNKAVLTYDEAGGDPKVVGYLRGDQLPEIFLGKEYLVTIDGATYGSGKVFSQELFDLILNSLRIKSN